MQITSTGKMLVILVAVACFAYLSSLGNPFIWDDEQFITQNVYVQTFNVQKIFTTNTVSGAGVVSNYYRPLTTLSFALDTAIWGKNSLGFHLINLVLHIGSGVVLFFFLQALELDSMLAFWVSLFFLIDPLQTEAVTYINSRGDSLFAFLLLLSYMLFLYGLKKSKKVLLLSSLFLFGLSILAKETALFGILLFPVILFIYNRQKKSWVFLLKRASLPFAGLAGLAGSYALLRLTVLNFQDTLNYYTVQDVYSSHLAVRLFTFCKILFIYISLLFSPYPLHMERSVGLVTSFFSGWVIGALFVSVAAIGLAIWVFIRAQKPWMLFGLAWMGIFLLPVSGIIPINGMLYEHWLYLPLVGFFLFLFSGLRLLVLKIHAEKVFFGFLIVLAGCFVILTIRQNNIWADPITFYRYTLSFAPDSARLHNNLGMSYANAGESKRAVMEYQKALLLGPGYPQIYNNLGNAEIVTGDYTDAEKNLKKALQMSPDFFVAQQNLVKLYLVSRQYPKALQISHNDPEVEQYIQALQKQ